MKNFFKPLLISLLIHYSFTAYSQDAVQYMEKMSDEFKNISEETWDYTRTAAHSKKLKKIENKRKDVLNANKSALMRIKNMPTFNGDGSLRDSTVKYLELSYAVMNEDYSKIVDLEEVAEESYDAMEAYMKVQEIANDKLDAAWEIADNAQKNFCAKYNIKLNESKDQTTLKLEKAGEVYKYYKKVYLALFKPAKQEMYLMASMSKSDVSGIKQNQEALALLAKESKEKLKNITPYKGNVTLKASCNEAMNFYIYEAETKGAIIVDFFLKKEKFEKLKIYMDKNGKSASKEEIDEYNNALKELNKTLTLFNNLNNDLNNRRNAVFNKWDNAVSNLYERNIAKK